MENAYEGVITAVHAFSWNKPPGVAEIEDQAWWRTFLFPVLCALVFSITSTLADFQRVHRILTLIGHLITELIRVSMSIQITVIFKNWVDLNTDPELSQL